MWQNSQDMKRIALLLFVFVLLSNAAKAQSEKSIRIAFWNMENFFDPFPDSTRAYNDYTPEGMQHWTKSRFYKKRNNIYKVILAMSESRPLGIMGVCEIENEYVINMVYAQTPLKKFNYSWVHYDSPERRGIDAAIVYSKDIFTLVGSKAITYSNPKEPEYHSRDIVYGKFIDNKHGDTLHVLVNHWPSKYSGELETVESRNCAAAIVRRCVDSLMAVDNDAKIVIMGDMNDEPDANSVHDILKARHISECTSDRMLVNLFARNEDFDIEGTLKFHEKWQIYDQIILSNALVNSTQKLVYKQNSAKIFHTDFMLEEDLTYNGLKLKRTYLGPRYLGGFSDHLPVYIDLKY